MTSRFYVLLVGMAAFPRKAPIAVAAVVVAEALVRMGHPDDQEPTPKSL